MDERVPWDQYFMNIAQVVASRSTCPRKFVGSVIVRDRTILSTGYNGSIRGMPHCTEVGHMMENDHCVATIHAEANAIIQAAKNGVMIDGATIYVTASPCWSCFKMIANSGPSAWGWTWSTCPATSRPRKSPNAIRRPRRSLRLTYRVNGAQA